MEAFESVPIKLMGCGHVFCKNCLSGVLDNCLSNYSDFPVRCPTCSDFMAFRDIEFLADGPERYNKLRKIAINDFIGSNSDKICYCLTVGCDGIGFITTAKTVCDMCNKEYCLACKVIHPTNLETLPPRHDLLGSLRRLRSTVQDVHLLQRRSKVPKQKMPSTDPKEWRLQQGILRNVQNVDLLEVYETLPGATASL